MVSYKHSGLEMNYTPDDISNLNLAQMNPIVYKKNRGYVIETEKSPQTLYKSALSYLHVREVLIELERELSAMLLDFQWKFNTDYVRAEIKLRADVICEKYVNRNGLYNYFNKCDEENNTPTVIDNQIVFLILMLNQLRVWCHCKQCNNPKNRSYFIRWIYFTIKIKKPLQNVEVF
jgi:hypothetical protein